MPTKANTNDRKIQEQRTIKRERRILQFLNGVRSAQQIVDGPPPIVRLHTEYRRRAHLDQHEARGAHLKSACLCELELAERIIAARYEISPVYGFTNIREVAKIKDVRVLLDSLGSMLSHATKGDWEGPYTIPGEYDRPVHAAVCRTGKVMFFGLPNGNNTWLWTPSPTGAGTFAAPANQPTDSLFCAGHSFLIDGRLLVVGGGGDGTGDRHNRGWIFDPSPGVETWTQTLGNGTPNDGDMSFYRWYPTLVTLGDSPGRILVVSGDQDSAPGEAEQMEIYMQNTDRFELVWGPGGPGDTSANHAFPQIYPGLHLLPGGEVFYAPTGWYAGGCAASAAYAAALPSGYFELQSTSVPASATWTDVDTDDAPAESALDRVMGMSVLLCQPTYPYVQAMIVGGGADPESTTTFQMINLSTMSPSWGPPVALPDGLSRVNVNLALLPDGTVFMSGGRQLSVSPPNGGACWIYDPKATSWTEMDPVANARQYHSLTVLLPDARVATAGHECPDDNTIEIFSPPYLFKSDGSPATQPVITSAPALVHHGHEFDVETPDACAIDRVVLVRPAAVTHQTDSEQRVIHMNSRVTGPTTLQVEAPDGWHPHSLAPQGWYMLFLIDNAGVPSVAEFIELH